MAARDYSGAFDDRIRQIVGPLIDSAVEQIMTILLRSQPPPARRGPGRPPKSGAIVTPAALGTQACNVAGCTRPMRSKGYCAAHYQSARKYGWPMPAPVGFNAPVRRRGRPPKSEITRGAISAPGKKRGRKRTSPKAAALKAGKRGRSRRGRPAQPPAARADSQPAATAGD